METQLFLGEPARKEEEGRREGEQALQEVGVSGCGVRRRPAPRAKGHGKKKKERERTAENRFVTLGLFLIISHFANTIYIPAADSPLQYLSARLSRSSLDVNSQVIQPPFLRSNTILPLFAASAPMPTSENGAGSLTGVQEKEVSFL